MTVDNSTNKIQEAGNDVKVAFTFDFKTFQASDLEVFEIDQTTLVATQLTITTHYIVALNTITEGGTVTYVTAPATGKDSFIKRKLDLTQSTDVDTEESIPSQSLNNEYDRSRMIDIQQQEELDRSLKFAETSALSDIVIPEGTSAAARASKLLGYDADGTGFDLYTAISVVSVDPIAVQGDIVQGSSLGVAEKLAIGSSNQLLVVTSGKLAYSSTLAGLTLSSPIITTPTIASFTDATHDHSNAAGGGQFANLTFSGAAPSTPVADTIYKDSFIKGWAKFNVDGTVIDSKNVTTIDDDGVGTWGVNWVTDFVDDKYCAFVIGQSTGAGSASEHMQIANAGNSAGSAEIISVNVNDGTTERDPSRVFVVACGNQS